MMHMSRKMQNRTHAQELVTLRTGRQLPDLLHELYVERGLPQVEIAQELGITRNTLAMWLREYGVSRDPDGSLAPGHGSAA
jgi:DNA-binding XRE family transcriptional regulator